MKGKDPRFEEGSHALTRVLVVIYVVFWVGVIFLVIAVVMGVM